NMLTQIFNQVLTMSFVATVIIFGVIISRELLKRAPKIFAYILWGIVLFRLLCPISIESNFSIMPAGISTWVSNLVSGNEGITDQGDSMSIQSDFNDDLATDVNSVSEGSGDSSEALLSTSSIGDNSTNNITNNSTYSSADYGTSNSINDNTTNNTVLNLVNDNPLGMLMNIFAVIWLLGIVVIVTYNIILLIRLRMRLKSATLVQDNI
ncbi:MAG: hypothetical protein PF505_12710, partial [Vallitaleaceae bacterium]|nr:hypothetical protein [Vallitaleaceae bacterium]